MKSVSSKHLGPNGTLRSSSKTGSSNQNPIGRGGPVVGIRTKSTSGLKKRTVNNNNDIKQYEKKVTFQHENHLKKLKIPEKTENQTTKTLAGDYAARLQRMQDRLNKEINKNNVVKDGVKVPKKEFKRVLTIEEKVTAEIEEKNKTANSGIDLDLFPEQDTKPKSDVYSYERSKRAVEFRVLDKLDEDLSSCKNDKFQLVRKMNEKMIELDRLNEDKRTLSAQLINQIKFVRELQSQLGTSDNGHITEVIDKELEEQFKKEKYINVQLKQKLKECELEKLQIIEQLKFLEGQKDVTIVTKCDNHVDLEKSSMNIDEMIKYRSKIIKDNDEIQKDLHTLSLEEERAARSIEETKSIVNKVSEERRHYANQIQKQQQFFDDGTSMIVRDKNDLYYELRRQRLMLGGKVLSKAINKSMNSRKKQALDQFTIAMKWNDLQIGSILAFRKLLIKYESQRLSKGIHHWYRQSLKPVKLLRLNEVVVHHQLKHEPLRKMLIKWNQQKIIAQKVTSSQRQIMAKCLHNMLNFNKRALKYAFSVWRMQSNNKTLAKSKMSNFMRDKINYKILQAFRKWQAVELHQDYTMRVKNICVRGAVKQFLISIFNGWRQITVRLKSQRISLQIRVIMCFRKNVEISRQKTRYIGLLLRQKKSMDKFYLKAAYNGLRLSKENIKYDLVAKILEQDCVVAIKTAMKGLSNHRTEAMATRIKRKLNILFQACGRQLNAYFYRWKIQVLQIRKIHMDRFKLKLYTIWRLKLQKSFKFWHDGGHNRVRKKKMMIVDEMESSNQIIEDNLKKLNDKIAVQDVRSINKGNVRANKIMKKIWCKNIGKWFNLWHQQMKHQDHKGEKLENVVIKKLQRRILKSWFKRYITQAKLAKKLSYDDVKSEDYANILTYNSKKRMFKSMKTFTKNHILAKRQFQRIYTACDLKAKKLFFSKWHDGHHSYLKEERKKHQNFLVETLHQKNLESGDCQNLCHSQQKLIEAQTKQRESMHQKTMAKCIARFMRYRQYAAILTWRMKLAEYKEHYSKIKHSFIQRMLHRQQFAAFQTWRRNGTIQHNKKKKMMIEQMVSEQQAEKNHIEEIQKNKKLVKEVKSVQKQQHADVSNYNLKKYRNVVSKIISQTNNLFCVKRIEHIFNLWRNYTQDKRRWVLKLEKLILKNHHQIAFDAIRVTVYKDSDKSAKNKKLVKVINLWLRRRQFTALHTWKEKLFEHAKSNQKQTEETLFHKINNDAYSRSDCQKSITNSQIFMGKLKIAKNVFISLFDYKCRKKFVKWQNQQSKEIIAGLRARQAVQIWRSRAIVTKVQRMNKRNLQYTIGNRKMREVWKALKQNFIIKRTIMKRISNADRVMRKHNLEIGFKAIMHAKNLKNEKVAYGFKLADSIINKMIAQHIRKRIFLCLMRMKTSAVGLRKRDTILTCVIKTRWVNRVRKYFDTYRKNAQKEEVKVFCNEIGPVRLEKIRIDRDKKNLKLLLIQDGYTLEECNKIVDQNDQRFKALTEKSLCRLYCYGSEENPIKLLPWCFDKLLQFKKERQSYGYWFNLLELRTNMHKTDLMFAFEKWKMVRGNRNKTLENKKYNFLLEIDKLNLLTIGEQAGEMQEKHAIIDDIKEQRTFLIGKVISSQRLALDRCNQSYKKALERAWRHWVHHKHQSVILDHHQQTHQNLGHLGGLKERQDFLHAQNHELAEENDKLKEGALHSVSMMATAEELQKEIEKQSHVLTDRANAIRKLIETNAKLHQKLKLAHLNSQYS